MNCDTLTRRIVTAVLIVLLLIGPTAAIGKNGKKYFKEGQRLELSEKWDQAAEQFALALNEEPGNQEYQVHYRRSLVRASLAFMDMGRRFEESDDWSSAYKAYLQSYSYDSANEQAKIRMKIILDTKGIKNSNGIPMSKEFVEKANSESKIITTSDGSRARPDTRKPKVVLPPSDVSFQKGTQIRQVIQSLARSLNLNVIFDEAFKDFPLKDSFELRGETAARALDLLLLTNKLFYAQMGIRTIVVSNDAAPNRQRYQDMFVKTFYVRNADIAEVTRVIQAQLGTKAIGTAKNLNAIIVRETAPNMQVIESILSALDKSPAEVIIDVNMYEVAHTDMLQIGNQFATDGTNIPTLPAIGQLFAPRSVATTNPTTGQTNPTPGALVGSLTRLIGPNIAIGVPPSTISFLQNSGHSKLLHSTQMRAFENEDAETKVGERIPIQTAQIPVYSTTPVNTTTQSGTTPNTPTSLLGPLGTSYPQIQYEDIGLVIKMTPKITTSGDVHLKMSIVSTGVQNTNTLTPTITQRSMTGTAQIRDGQTSLIAGVLENSTDIARSGMPFVGWLPIIGYLFTTPTRRSNQTDIVVTVTPHIIRSAGITTSDTSAVGSGNMVENGARVSIEEIIDTANNYINEKSDNYKEVANTDRLFAPQSKQTAGNVETKRVANKSPDDLPEPIPLTAGAQESNEKTVSATRPSSTNELDGSDTTDDLNGPVSLIVRSGVPQTRVGQRIAVGIIASGPADLKNAKLTLNYNPGVLTFNSVSDGGLFRQGGVIPDLKQAVSSGQVSVEIARPDEAKGVRANGQLFVFYFDVTGFGDCELTIDNAQLVSPGGHPLQVSTTPFKIFASQ